MASDRNPLLLVISQVYVPDPASVGQHMADVAEMMAARGHVVRVLTSSRGYENPRERYPARERRGGVDVVRLPLSSFGKRTVMHRLLGQMLFLLQVIVRGMFARGLSGILVSTSPPMAALAAIAIGTVRRAPITYWVMDLNPDQAIALGKVSGHNPLVKAMRWLNARIFARAAAVVVLDRFMAERIERQYKVHARLEILPPWPHIDCGSRIEDCGSECQSAIRNPNSEIDPATFREMHGLHGSFVVMYSGNHSPANPIGTLLNAALALRDDPRFVFMFVGGGLAKREVDDAIATYRPKNIRSVPYQPLAHLQQSLSAADLHVVTLGEAMVGIIHPCKIYGAMAVGRPVLLVGPRPSHAADLIDEHAIGWQVDHGDEPGLIDRLREVVKLPRAELAAMGARAQQVVRRRFDKELLCGAMCDVLESTVDRVAVHETIRRPLGLDRLEPVAGDLP
jgi:glycosyltransferase involved in cell wall biosynthesis